MDNVEFVDFLRTVVTTEKGWFCLAHAVIQKNEEETYKSWTEQFYSWPDELPTIVNRVAELSAQEDISIYYSPYLFREQSSKKEYVLPSRTIAADLDEASILTLSIRPSVLVETSPDRHHGYWLLNKELSLDEHEELSQRLTYSIERCDRTGWYLGKKLRVPGTMNYKYATGPKFIRVLDVTSVQHNVELFENLPTIEALVGNKAQSFIDVELEMDWIQDALKVSSGPQELLATVKRSLPSRVVAQYNIQSQDRSTSLWALMNALFRAGFSKDKVFFLAYHSANNKFRDLRYGGLRELGKDVLRAEYAVNIKIPDIRAKIFQARSAAGNEAERKDYVAKIIREHLESLGSFIHTNDDNEWYIRDDLGKPISLSGRSHHLNVMLDSMFALNPAERDTSYVIHRLISHASEMPINGHLSILSYYDPSDNTFLLHTGRKDVLRVTRNDIDRVVNGYAGVVFPWAAGNIAISPKYQALDRSWDTELYDGCLDNLVGLSPAQAQAILKVWLLAVLLRDGLSARPILALLGAPGSGKSTLMKRVYALIYGTKKAVESIDKEDSFDFSVATQPFVAFDNADSARTWLPDRLALSAGTSDITRRRLYTDSDTVTIRRQAMIAITAHAPKFGREDVVDRMLLLNFERLSTFVPETEILNRITNMRNALWGAILEDIRQIFNTPVPREGWPQFRIEDLAKFGYWIATALNIQDNFKSGLEAIRNEQKSFILDEEGLLVAALTTLVDRQQTVEWLKPGQVWGKLQAYTSDPQGFVKTYRNAVMLGRKLWTMQDALKAQFIIEVRQEATNRAWKFSKKEAYLNGTAKDLTHSNIH